LLLVSWKSAVFVLLDDDSSCLRILLLLLLQYMLCVFGSCRRTCSIRSERDAAGGC
jgi:hypothetical protein